MAENRRRPAREKQRFEMLIMAEKWFIAMIEGHDCAQWSLVEEWRGLPVSTKIRRFMAEVKAGHPVACGVYGGSSQEIRQA